MIVDDEGSPVCKFRNTNINRLASNEVSVERGLLMYQGMSIHVVWAANRDHSMEGFFGKISDYIMKSDTHAPPDGTYKIYSVNESNHEPSRECQADRLNVYRNVEIRSDKGKLFTFLCPPGEQWNTSKSVWGNAPRLGVREGSIISGYHCSGPDIKTLSNIKKNGLKNDTASTIRNMLGGEEGDLYVAYDPRKCLGYQREAMKNSNSFGENWSVNILHVAGVLSMGLMR
jgi:hypothetical protein